MKKKKSLIKRRRKNRLHRQVVICFSILLSVFCIFLSARLSMAAADVANKEEGEKKDPIKPEGYSEYVYDAKNKTDPFASFLVKRKEILKELEEQRSKKLAALNKLKSLREARTELQKLELSQFQLTAIIKGPKESWAMVRDPKGVGYMLKKGTFIGDKGGSVDQIIRETKKSAFGKEYIRKVVIKEPYLDNDGNIKYKFIDMEMASQYYE